ncbi:hypothetical protein ACOME3_007693 [Neoechinorhynchus agilis]
MLLGHYGINDDFSARSRIDKKKEDEYYGNKIQWHIISNFSENQKVEDWSSQIDQTIVEQEHSSFYCDASLIDKDVKRCDRTIEFFKDSQNVDKLRNILCTYVWKHRVLGYIQGMCDVLAPLLYVLQDESLTHSCLCRIMDRMNFKSAEPANSMNWQFETLEMLIEWLDSDLYECGFGLILGGIYERRHEIFLFATLPTRCSIFKD